jgi:hypothetical protein
MRYERRHEPLATPEHFTRRLLVMGLIALGLILFSLGAGMAGYHWIVGLQDPLDCLLSAAMILGGMGPVGPSPATPAGKVFASLYALYCGVILLVSVGLLVSPLFHRLLHHFHVDEGERRD